jgi:hypothetical protein
MSVPQKDRLEMSQRERDRLKVLHGVKEGQFTQVKAAAAAVVFKNVRPLLEEEGTAKSPGKR